MHTLKVKMTGWLMVAICTLAMASTGYAQPVDMAISKTDNATTNVTGGFVSYTITVSNLDPQSFTIGVVTDVFPTELDDVNWTCTPDLGASCASGGMGNINEIVQLPAGTSVVFTANGFLNQTFTGILSNTATVMPDAQAPPDPNPANDSATDTTVVEAPVTDFSITKTDNATTAAPGSPVTYSIEVSNIGNVDTEVTRVTDMFPAELQAVTWTCTPNDQGAFCTSAGNGNIDESVTINPGSSLTFAATGTIDPGFTGTLSNTAMVEALFPDPPEQNLADNTATDTTDVVAPVTDFSITKTDNQTTAVAGESLSYTIVVSNVGDTIPQMIQVTDMFPAAYQSVTWTCAPGGPGAMCGNPSGAGDINEAVTISPGNFLTYAVNGFVDFGFTGVLSNIAMVAISGVDQNPADNSATDTTTVSQPVFDAGITKTDNQATAQAGDPLTYQIEISNLGDTFIEAVQVIDNFPAALTNVTWTCMAGQQSSCDQVSGTGNINEMVNIEAGEGVLFTATGTIDNGFSGNLSNTATINLQDDDPNNNTATDNTTVALQSADLVMAKTVSQSTAAPGDPITYTLMVSSAGPASVIDAMVVDDVPAELIDVTWVCSASGNSNCPASGSGDINFLAGISPGDQLTIVINGTVDQGVSGAVNNTATISPPADTNDPVPGNNSDSASFDIEGNADLAISKTDGQSTALPGSTLTYLIGVQHLGNADVPVATVTDNFPSGLNSISWTCSGSTGATCPASGSGNINADISMQAGSNLTFTVSAEIDSTFTGTLNNTASVSVIPPAMDPVQSNNTASDSTSVNASADLSVSKSGPDSAQPGDSLTFIVQVQNNGPDPASEVMLTDSWSAGLQFQSVDSELFTCGELMGQMVVCQADELAVDQVAELQFEFLAGNNIETGDVLVNQVMVNAATQDPNFSDNQAMLELSVDAPLMLFPEQTQLPMVMVGEDFAFEFNTSGGVAPVSLTIAGLPAGLAASQQENTLQVNGMPEQGGLFTLMVTAQDSAQPPVTIMRDYTLQVGEQLQLQPATLPTANTDQNYLAQVSVANGVPPFNIEVSGLPAGLTAVNGTIQGQPQNAGMFTLQASAVDTVGNAGTRSLSLTVNSGVEVGSQGLPDGVVDVSYSAQLLNSGAADPVIWTGGAGLPGGLQLSETGFIGGQPQAAGEFAFAATVTDANGSSATGNFSITVQPEGLVTQQLILPDGLVGRSYFTPTAIDGGIQPYTCTLQGSNLPDGLTLDGCNLGISGVPQEPGTFSFGLDILDASEPPQSLLLPTSLQIAATTPVPLDEPPQLDFEPPASSPVDEFDFGSPGAGFTDESLQAVTSDAFGNRYLVGFSWNGIDYDILVLKYNNQGQLVWNQRFDSGSQDYGYAVAVSPLDQSLHVGGYSMQGNGFVGTILSFDLAGVLQRTVFDNSFQVTAYYALLADNSGVYALGESFNGNDFDALITRFDNNGTQLWQTTRATAADETAYAGTLSNCDEVACDLIFGGVEGNVLGSGFVAGIDRSGSNLAAISNPSDAVFAIEQADNDDLLVGGTSTSNDWVIQRMSSAGNMIWNTTVGMGERLRGLQLDAGGFVVVAGSAGAGQQDGLVAVLNADGELLSTQVLDQGVQERFTGSVIGPEGLLSVVGEKSAAADTEFLFLNYNTGKAF